MRLLALAVGAAAQQCALSDNQKNDCYPWGTANQTVCLAHGCCWNPTSSPGVAWCYYPLLPTPSSAQCAAVTVPSRIDCHPEPNADQPSCEARGCCWSPYGGAAGAGVKGVAACFFPHTDGYTAGPKLPTSGGFTANLALGSQSGPYRNDITPLVLNVEYRSSNTLRFTIGDPNSDRWVPPVPLEPAPGTPPASTDYSVAITQAPEPFGITVTRTSTGTVLFDSRVSVSSSSGAAHAQQKGAAAAARHPRADGGLPPRGADAIGTAASGVVTNGLIFEDQYLEISSSLPVSGAGNVSSGGVYVYGLAEHINPLQLPSDGPTGQIYTMLARDQGTPVHASGGNTNLYASQPFYMVHDPATGEAFGVFLFNSNAMDILLQQSNPSGSGEAASAAVTYRVLGGVLDFYIFTGPTPADVVQQYLALVGTPRMPPRWALGFHLCRWGYNSLNQTQAIWQSMIDNNMPQDAQWNDIDLFDRYLDFTTDPAAYPGTAMAAWLETLHNTRGQHYVHIIDPGISSTQGTGVYPAWDEGLQAGIFINDTNGNVLIGKVWPGLTGFPDFLHPNATAWWQAQFARYMQTIAIDGAWIDMNEPSNFCDGQCSPSEPAGPADVAALTASWKDDGSWAVPPRPTAAPTPAAIVAAASPHNIPVGPGYPAAPATAAVSTTRGLFRDVSLMEPEYGRGAVSQGAFPGDPMFPPYLPGRLGGATLLETKTVAMSAKTYPGLHYNSHNLYGWSEGVATVAALEAIRGKRGFVVSRSTAPTSGKYVNHWLGDNAATWDDLYYNIPGVLTFNMLGVPMVGADVCGFGGDATTPELCTRWQQLGAFVNGFYRNHNTIGKQEQAPSVFADPYKSYIRDALNARLTIVPYLYTLFAEAHAYGKAVTRPLFFEFPTDANVAGLDTQVMLGGALMVSPVIFQGATTKTAYFPAGAWYDWFTGAPFNGSAPGWNTIPAPLSSIPVHVRGGYIVPTQDPNMTTVFSAVNPFRLTVALAANGTAVGGIFLDDGDSIDTMGSGAYTVVTWAADASGSPTRSTGTLTSTVAQSGYTPPASATLQSVRILGVQEFSAMNGRVTVNGALAASWSYTQANQTLTAQFNVPIVAGLTLNWLST